MTRSKKKQKNRGNKNAADAIVPDSPPSKQENLDILVDEAEAAIDSFNYDTAEAKLKEYLNHNPNNTKALEMLASVYIEESDWMQAENLLKRCIDLSPEIGHSKYFSLAQFNEGEESLRFYQKGIQVIEKEIGNWENIIPAKDEDERKRLIRSLSDAYCSISEIYMTDCCDSENAEGNCFSAIEAAISSDPSNTDAYQSLANFHLVKGQTKEAKEATEKSLSFWLPLHEALRDGELDETASKDLENVLPSYDSRIQTSKLLIELEMLDEATNILDGLYEEDDEVVEVLYLLGWTNYNQGDDYKLNAHYYLKKAKEMGVKTGLAEVECMSHIDELLEELQASHPLDADDTEEMEDLEWDIESDSE
ncbi:hypothetical protein JTE90_016945 [Oedothorax gibbosus]|uniref:Assembly chaperone of rpl4 n=1 Tax=Oedothorax gibbosus TaxID=931172 RepID=A0AAV6UST6_9ARAC|nr:hypothetical protein JTE90_016945 [Oedothorax gibbosus]